MDRKEMVKKLSEFLGVKHKYLGAPSFAYEVAAGEKIYTIDRQGTITTAGGKITTLEEILQAEQPEETGTPEGNEDKPELIGFDGCEVKLPLEGHTGVTLQNIVNMLASKQHLIMKAFKLTEELLDKTFAEDLSSKEISTIEDFKTALMELGPERCQGLTFDFEQETLTFKLAAENLDADKIAAFQDLIAFINQTAQKLKRSSFKPTQDDNPKYAFRTWLSRLGMNGKEYKTTRKVLLVNLEGSGAFRKVDMKDE